MNSCFQIVLERNMLLKLVQPIVSLIEKKQAAPILSYLLVKINNGLLSVTGTDSEIKLRTQVDLQSDISAQFTVAGRKLLDILRLLPEGAQINLKGEKNRLILSCEKSRFSLLTLPVEDFPNLEVLTEQVSFSLNQADLLYLLNHSYFSIAQQDVRYYLNGLSFAADADRITCVSIDGHRLSLVCAQTTSFLSEKTHTLIPRKTILELMKILNPEGPELKIKLNQQMIEIEGENYSLISKLIEGGFPSYIKAIDTKKHHCIILEKDLLKQAITRVATLSHEKQRGIILNFGQHNLKITASNIEQEIAEEDIAIDYQGKDIEVCLNVNYVLDALNANEPDFIKIYFLDGNNSIFIEPAEKNEKYFLFSIMPMFS